MEIQQSHQSKLLLYYKYMYPINYIVQWFSYTEPGQAPVNLSFRQFSFTLDIDGNQIYKRFISFKSVQDFRSLLISDVPVKMDIGAVMQHTPQKGTTNTPRQKEFVLDIDMDEYDSVRTCCEGAKVCYKCWKLMRVACRVLYDAMSIDFGFKDILFVFSGRRGLHIWVCDPEARKMQNQVRKNVMNYLMLVSGGDKADSHLAEGVFAPPAVFPKNLKPRDYMDREYLKRQHMQQNFHPFITRSLNTISKYFTEIFEQQKILENLERREVIKKILKNRSPILEDKVAKRWGTGRGTTSNSATLYNMMVEEIIKYQKYPDYYKGDPNNAPSFQPNRDDPFRMLSFIQQQIMLTFLYPRLDVNVSTNMNHLLKCPFSVHPKSLKVSVPFSSSEIDTFDPDTCITIDIMMKEMRSTIEEEELKTKSPEQISKLTGLNGAVRTLEYFLQQMVKNKKQAGTMMLEV